MSISDNAATSPWGRFDLQPGSHGAWRIGPLALWAERDAHEWSVAGRVVADPLDETASFARGAGPMQPLPDDPVRSRCAIGSGGPIHVAPALADRPVVVRAEQPLTLLPDDEARLFISSPAWVKLSVGEPARRWGEFPTLRPSDTWFGPSTRVGELCYAATTRARTTLAGEPIRPARVVTAIQVKNQASEPLVFERLKVPIGHLALFLADNGRLWTQSLSVTRKRDSGDVDCRVEPELPNEAGPTTAIEGARLDGPGILTRALHALIG